MQVGMIGLGKMGMNLTMNLIDHGHQVIVHDASQEAMAKAGDKGAIPAGD